MTSRGRLAVKYSLLITLEVVSPVFHFSPPGGPRQAAVEARGDGGGQQPLYEHGGGAPAERAAPGTLPHPGPRRMDPRARTHRTRPHGGGVR